MDLWWYPLLFLTGLVAGCVDAIAGGGGLLTVPVLLATGLPPQEALGTNKFQSSCGTTLATWNYARHGLFDGQRLRVGIVATLVGAQRRRPVTLVVRRVRMEHDGSGWKLRRLGWTLLETGEAERLGAVGSRIGLDQTWNMPKFVLRWLRECRCNSPNNTLHRSGGAASVLKSESFAAAR